MPLPCYAHAANSLPAKSMTRTSGGGGKPKPLRMTNLVAICRSGMIETAGTCAIVSVYSCRGGRANHDVVESRGSDHAYSHAIAKRPSFGARGRNLLAVGRIPHRGRGRDRRPLAQEFRCGVDRTTLPKSPLYIPVQEQWRTVQGSGHTYLSGMRKPGRG